MVRNDMGRLERQQDLPMTILRLIVYVSAHVFFSSAK